MSYLFFLLILTFACTVQGLTGFGAALVAMPLFTAIWGLQFSAPLMAPIMLMFMLSMLWRYQTHFHFEAVWRLALPSLCAIPIGVWLVQKVAEQFLLPIIGVIIAIYVLGRLLHWQFPPLAHPNWAIPFGFLGGLLSGGYNTSGPPIVIYANTQRWPPETFKANLQAYFLLNTVMNVATHALNHHYSAEMRPYLLLTPLAILLSHGVINTLQPIINPHHFEQLVMIMLLLFTFYYLSKAW